MKKIASLEDLLAGTVAETTETPALVPEETRGIVNAVENQRVLRRMDQAIELTGEVQGAVDDTSDIQDTLASVAVDGKVSVETIVFTQLAVRANPALRGMRMAAFGPSLEAIAGTDDVTVSVEGIGDMLKGMLSGLGHILGRWVEECNRAFAFTATRTLASTAALNKLMTHAARHRGASVDGRTVLVNGGNLLVNGAPPKNPAQMLTALAGTMDYMVSRFQPEMLAALRQNARAIALINDSSDEAFRKTFDATVKAWKVPSGNPAQLNATLPGDYVLFGDDKSTYHGNDPTLAKLDAIATKGVMRTWLEMGVDSPAGEVGRQEFPALSPDQIHAVASAHVKTLSKVRKMESAMQSLVSGWRAGSILHSLPLLGPAAVPGALFLAIYTNTVYALVRSIPLAAYPGGRQYKEQVRYMRRALRSQERSIRYATFDSTQMELMYVRQIVAYCRRSLRVGGFA